MDPVTTLGAGTILFLLIVIFGCILFLKLMRKLRHFFRVLFLILMVLRFIGLRPLLVIAAAGMGWYYYTGMQGPDEWWVSIPIWFVGVVLLLTTLFRVGPVNSE